MKFENKRMMTQVFREALDREDGVEIKLGSYEEAKKFRFYLYNLRRGLLRRREPGFENIGELDIKLVKGEGGGGSLVLKIAGKLFDSVRVTDVATGALISERFEAVDEMVELSEEELGVKP